MASGALRRPLVVILLLLLMASFAGNILLYRQASRPLFEEGDRPLIERTVALFPRMNREDIRTVTFPIVMRQGDRTCVELRRHDGLGHFGACYDGDGRLIQQTEGVSG
jgi:hypothetical protein